MPPKKKTNKPTEEPTQNKPDETAKKIEKVQPAPL